MKIDRSNYEEYMQDYLEGNLKGAILQELEEFLRRYPELNPVQEDPLEFPYLSPQRTSLDDKADLFRSFDHITQINAHNFEELCVAYIEGDLSHEMQKKLLRFAEKNTDFKNILAFYEKIRYNPDLTLTYPEKASLIKHNPRNTVRYIFTVAAAAIALFFVISKIPHYSTKIDHHPLATEQESTHISKPQPISKGKEIPKVKALRQIKTEINNSEPTIPAKIAVFDTNHPRKQNKVTLAQLQPILPHFQQQSGRITINLKPENTVEENDNKGLKGIMATISDDYYAIKTSKVNLVWQVIRAGIKGINNLTENDIQLHTTTDQEGNVVQFALRDERFEINKKLKKNEQN